MWYVLTETGHAVVMGDLTETGHAVEMGDLTVACYEDGGAMPLCDVALSQIYQNNRHLVVGGNYARSSLGLNQVVRVNFTYKI